MISDTLCEAAEAVQGYLDDPTYDSVYEGQLRARILALVEEMEEVRAYLDRVPEDG